MLMNDFVAALKAAPTSAAIDEIARHMWIAYCSDEIEESVAAAMSEHIEEARQRFREKPRASAAPLRVVSPFGPRKRRCVSPDRLRSRERRRRLAYSGPLPPALAAGFTPGQLATLAIVADEARARGECTLALGAIAARAGVGVTTARDAIRLAQGDGLLSVTERPRRGARNLTNVVKVISPEWRAWLAHRARTGSKKANPTDNKAYYPVENSTTGPRQTPARREIAPCQAANRPQQRKSEAG